MNTYPQVSIIIPTRNCATQLEECLLALKNQTYKNLEILIIDGESTDATRDIAKKYPVTIIPNPDILAEPGVNLGMEKAHGDLFMIIAVDNIYKDPQAIETIVRTFDNPSIYAAYPKHQSDSSDTLFTQYINTFTDPFNHFVYQNAANARTFHRLYKILEHTETYDVYDYKSNATLPMIAFAQGFTIRSEFRRKSHDTFDDISPVLDLIQSGKKIAYVHAVLLYHHTIQSLEHFLRKQSWTTLNALKRTNYGVAHRKNTFTQEQKIRTLLWPLYAFSLILPFIRSIWGVIQDRRLIWLFHPIICFISAYASAKQVILFNLDKSTKIVRQ